MSKIFFVLLFVFLVIIIITDQNAYSQTIVATGVWQEHEYIIVEYPNISWEMAMGELGPDYYLATITSQEEDDFISSLLQGGEIFGEYWLGGYQTDPNADPDQTWVWVTGEDFCYTNWGESEPNDWEGYVESHLGKWNLDPFEGGKWNDEHEGSGNVVGYIAETGPMYMDFDIKPGVEPNSLVTSATYCIPVAILGTPCLDVHKIDPSSILLEGVSPAYWTIKDLFAYDENGNTIKAADGFDDLIMQFHNQDLVAAVGDGYEAGDVVQLELTGSLFEEIGGISFIGWDDMFIYTPGCWKKSAEPGISGEMLTAPDDYALSQNYPNPFNPETKIRYSILETGNVSLKVFDISGRIVAILVDGIQSQGEYNVVFNANDLPSGLYFYALQAGSFSQMKSMLLIK